jgi:hypothetical protein
MRLEVNAQWEEQDKLSTVSTVYMLDLGPYWATVAFDRPPTDFKVDVYCKEDTLLDATVSAKAFDLNKVQFLAESTITEHHNKMKDRDRRSALNSEFVKINSTDFPTPY